MLCGRPQVHRCFVTPGLITGTAACLRHEYRKPVRRVRYALPSTLVHPVSKTRRRQPSLLTASCYTTSQIMLMRFKSRCMVSIQFFRGLPGFLFEPLLFQYTACHDSLLSSIRKTCPSHLSLLPLMTTSIFSSCVCTPTLSLLTLSFHEVPIILLWNLWCAPLL